jgi:hypothetical protein
VTSSLRITGTKKKVAGGFALAIALVLLMGAVTKLDLANQVQGLLAIANGGTGAATAAANSVFGNSTGSSAAPSFTATPVVTSIGTGTPPTCAPGTAGAWCSSEGTAPTAVTAVDQIYGDSTAHAFKASVNGGTAGLLAMVMPGAIHQTAKTATISTTTLCAASAGACNQAGQYQIRVGFIQTGTACTTVTAGSVIFGVTWVDTNGTTHTAVPVPISNQAAPTAVAGAFNFTTGLTSAGGSGVLNISTNGTVINYVATYAACTSGTGTYQLDATVTRLQ